MRHAWAVGLGALVIALSSLASSCAGDDKPETAAQVGPTQISMAQFGHQLREGEKLKRQYPSLADRITPALVLRDLIKSEWLIQEALARGVEIPPPSKAGLSDRRTLASRGLMRSVMANKRFVVSEAELREYLISHRADLATPPQRLAQVFEARTKGRALAAAHALRQGNDPVGVRARFGGGVANITADRTGFTSIEQGGRQVPSQLEQAIFSAAVDEEDGATRVGGPVKADGVWYIFRVLKATPPVAPTLRNTRDRVTLELQTQKSTAFFEQFLRSLRGKYRPRTVCDDALVIAECRNSVPSTS